MVKNQHALLGLLVPKQQVLEEITSSVPPIHGSKEHTIPLGRHCR